MPGSDELYPPAQYGGGWMLLAIGILLALIAAAWIVALLTRPRRVPPTPPESVKVPMTAEAVAALRSEYLERIARIEADYRDRRLSPRQANFEMSRVVRTFVNEFSGLEAPVLSLDDLVGQGVHPALVDAMTRHYYPSIFRPGPSIDPIAGAEAARKVVNLWH